MCYIFKIANSQSIHCSKLHVYSQFIIGGNGYEAGLTSKDQTKIPRFMLEGPRPCTTFRFVFIYNEHELRNQSISIGQFSVRSKQLLCLVQGQGQKSEQKHTTKNFVEFHNLPLYQLWFTQVSCSSNEVKPKHYEIISNEGIRGRVLPSVDRRSSMISINAQSAFPSILSQHLIYRRPVAECRLRRWSSINRWRC